MKYKVFIDGSEGTTGLQIYDRLGKREDVEILSIDGDKYKDVSERKRLINASDVVFFCLPDAAAIEAAGLVENPKVRVIDASTAHRVSADWVYGMPELSARQSHEISEETRVANPGCHATGFIMPVYPLVKSGVIPKHFPLVCHSVTGYSGGGKKMIAEYENPDRKPSYGSPRQYALSLKHKHVPEMQKTCMLTRAPVFNPIVADFYAGMAVTVPLHNFMLNGSPSAKDIHEILSEYYEGCRFVKVAPFMGEGVLDGGYLEANVSIGTNYLEIFVCGNEDQTVLITRFDNLGKGASGAAVQNMNIMLGLDEGAGL